MTAVTKSTTKTRLAAEHDGRELYATDTVDPLRARVPAGVPDRLQAINPDRSSSSHHSQHHQGAERGEEAPRRRVTRAITARRTLSRRP